MKGFNIKSVFLGFVIGTVGITTVFAANAIKSVALSNAKVTFDGASVPLNNSLVAIEKDGKINSPKHNIDLPESPSIPNNRNIPMSNDIPEHFTSGAIAETTNNSNAYTYEGVIGSDKFQFGNPFPANKGEQLTFKLNSLEYVSGEVMEEDESILRVVLGSDNNENNWVGFNFMLKSLNKIALSMPALETATHHITILNYSGKEVKYSFTLTIK